MPCRSTLTMATRRRRRFVALLKCLRRKGNCVCSACGRMSGNITFTAGREASLQSSVSSAWTRRRKARISPGQVLLLGDEEHVVVPHGQSHRSGAIHKGGGTVEGIRAAAR